MADISSIKLPNNSTYNIKAKKIYYAECETASTDITKVVACDGFILEKGAIIAIRFTDTGTTYPTSGNISLNINGTGAKNIVSKGSNIVLAYNWSWAFRANQTCIFVYDGTHFAWLNQDNNTTYSNFVKSGPGAKAGLVPAPSTTAGTTKYLREDGTWTVPPDTHVTVDTALSTTSTNPVQNQLVTTALNDKKPWKYCVVGQSGSTHTNPWYKFASISTTLGYDDPVITFKVNSCYATNTTCVGILTAHLRTSGASQWEASELVWEYAASGIDASKFVMAYNTATSPTICELWVKCDVSYRRYQFEVLWEGNGRGTSSTTGWQLHSLSSAGSQSAITSGLTQKASIYLTLKNNISGRASNATFLSSYSSNTLTANKSGTWTCFAYANKSSWFPTTSNTSRFIRFTVYDSYLENGIYDVTFNLLCVNNVYTKVLFTANRLDDDNPTTSNIAVRFTDSRIEFWMKQIGISRSTIWISGMLTSPLSIVTDSSLRGLTDFPSGGTVYYPEYSINTATALTTSAGSATQPVYFSGGKPVACTYPLNLMTGATSSAAGTNGLVPSPAAGAQAKFLRGDGTWQMPANTDTVFGHCKTAAGTAAKGVTFTDYSLLAKSQFILVLRYTNTAASALTLNVNGKGAKPIYINGKPSSSTNYTLPAGTYEVYYDGTNYYFWTDGTLMSESYSINNSAKIQYNSTNQCIDFKFS